MTEYLLFVPEQHSNSLADRVSRHSMFPSPQGAERGAAEDRINQPEKATRLRSGSLRIIRWLLLSLLLSSTNAAIAQLDFEQPPVRYSESDATDSISKLAEQLQLGDVRLKWNSKNGYLTSLLQALDIPQSSQTLVFSKTSLQVSRITPQRPRAIYFSDDVYIGWVQNGDVIEISAADPMLGGTFYTLDQDEVGDEAIPVIKRETARCLQCHGSTHTRRIPGHIVRSVFPDDRGQPVFRLGTHLTDNRSPFEERWGGWYVSGTHGSQRHMGNVFLENPDESEELPIEDGANLTDLSDRFDTTPYLNPHSDIVALMVLQHQVHVHNVFTAANHSGRRTERDAVIMNKALERDSEYESDSTRRRYENAAEKVVKALLFCDEVALTDRVTGSSNFATEFSERGPFDDQNRSLRNFDLERRLFRYPCSFLIYSDAFRALPAGVATRIRHRLKEVLSGEDQSEDFAHLSREDRRAVAEILAATIPDFSD